MPMWKDVRSGMLDILPVLVAACPIGLLWGTLAAGKGLSTLEATLMSTVVFAGASQFIALEVWGHPVPWLLLGVTALIVNLRHVLMGASLTRHLGAVPQAWRVPMLWFMADENWALAERRALTHSVTLGYWLGSTIPMVLTWVASSAVGAAVGLTFGRPEALGFDFAFSAMFIGIVAGFVSTGSSVAVLVASAIASATAKAYIPGPWFILIGGLAGVAVAALLWRPEAAAEPVPGPEATQP
jgi:4-azaleucine resistance transporter AzlC